MNERQLQAMSQRERADGIEIMSAKGLNMSPETNECFIGKPSLKQAVSSTLNIL